MLLGLDLEAFNGRFGPDSRLLKSPYLNSFLEATPGSLFTNISKEEEAVRERLKGISSSKQGRFKAILSELRNQTALAEQEFSYDPETGEIAFPKDTVLGIAYGKRQPMAVQGIDSVEVFGRFKVQAHTLLEGQRSLMPERVRYLLDTIQLCVENDIAITAFLAPMHPLLEKYLVRETHYLQLKHELETLIKENLSHAVDYVDCSVPEKFAGNDQDFRDEAHIGGYNADSLLTFLLQAPVEATPPEQ